METPADELTKEDAFSFHSSIPDNPEHSRMAVAYDLAIGQARSIDDEAFYTYLCRVADWRLGWAGGGTKDNEIRPTAKLRSWQDRTFDDDGPHAATLAFYQNEAPTNKALIDATADYRATGNTEAYPQYFNPPMPSLVRNETRG
jgi:hypothetical protein